MWEVNWLQKTAHLTHRVLSQGAGLQMVSLYFDTGSKTLTERALLLPAVGVWCWLWVECTLVLLLWVYKNVYSESKFKLSAAMNRFILWRGSRAVLVQRSWVNWRKSHRKKKQSLEDKDGLSVFRHHWTFFSRSVFSHLSLGLRWWSGRPSDTQVGGVIPDCTLHVEVLLSIAWSPK